MKTWVIVRKKDYAILGSYKSNTKRDTSQHYSWLSLEPYCTHVEVPNGTDMEYAYARMMGSNIVVSEYVEAKAADKLAALRSARDGKLAACDWTQLADVPLGSGQKSEWATYRQALRDITDSYQSIDTVVWPTEPPVEV